MNNLVLGNEIIDNYDPEMYVYDICLDGTLINALGNNVVTQTDGFNYSMPSKEELDGRVYIGKGLNRNTIEGKIYKGVEADVAEFSDLFLRGKMGLGIDEYALGTINFMRKTYADLLEDGTIKIVGNSIKSKKMPLYIENFLTKAAVQLLNNNGKEFLDSYYDYIERIYNYDIPLREIASKGRAKKTIKEYKINCKGVNKAGNKNSRVAWYELCIENNYEPQMGETIYYINNGSKKGDGDVKREKIYKTDEDGKPVYVDSVDVNGQPILTPKGKQKREKVEIGEEIVLNCVMIPSQLIENENNLVELGDKKLDEIEYNVPKYIEQFNKKIKPLLVCFHPDIRNSIIISNPNGRQFFTEKQAELTSGYPNKPEDQDTYEQLMKMEEKEIRYWTSVNEIPPFVNDINMDWSKIVDEYNDRQELLKTELIKVEVDLFNSIIDKLTKEDVDDFIEDPKISKEISAFLDFNQTTMEFTSKLYNVVIGTIYDIIDKDFSLVQDDETINNEEQ